MFITQSFPVLCDSCLLVRSRVLENRVMKLITYYCYYVWRYIFTLVPQIA